MKFKETKIYLYQYVVLTNLIIDLQKNLSDLFVKKKMPIIRKKWAGLILNSTSLFPKGVSPVANLTVESWL